MKKLFFLHYLLFEIPFPFSKPLFSQNFPFLSSSPFPPPLSPPPQIEGVMVARKDFNCPKHHFLDVKNLYVVKSMQSLRSRGYVRENFSWMWYYYYLTDEGIEYLRFPSPSLSSPFACFFLVSQNETIVYVCVSVLMCFFIVGGVCFFGNPYEGNG